MPQHTSASGLPPTYSEQPPFPSPHSPTVTDICVSCPLRRHHSRPWLSNSRINEYSEFGPRASWYLMPSLHSSCSVCSVRMYLTICGPHDVNLLMQPQQPPHLLPPSLSPTASSAANGRANGGYPAPAAARPSHTDVLAVPVFPDPTPEALAGLVKQGLRDGKVISSKAEALMYEHIHIHTQREQCIWLAELLTRVA